jgi:hypothetical protein
MSVMPSWLAMVVEVARALESRATSEAERVIWRARRLDYQAQLDQLVQPPRQRRRKAAQP